MTQVNDDRYRALHDPGRRRLLQAGLCGATTLLPLGQTLAQENNAGQESSVGRFVQPVVRRSRNGLLDTTLRMATTTVQVGSRVLRVATYEGTLPGPTLRFRGGDRLRIRLENDMTPLGLLDNGANPPGFNPEKLIYTNIHTHGLQVSPVAPADDVFRTIVPGDRFQYEYRVPKNQPAGLHWYHPHRHGATTHQAWQGLSGALVVEGNIDEVPAVKAAKDMVMILNGLWVNPDGEVPTALVVPNAGWSPFTSIPAVPTDMIFTINGVYQPTIFIRPGETQRWRILAAAPHRFFWIKVEGHDLYQIGQDGIPFASTKKRDSLMLVPGNRGEIIIQGQSKPGIYPIIAQEYDQGHPGGPRPERILGYLAVTGPEKEMPLPGKLVEPPQFPLGAPTGEGHLLAFKGDISSAPVEFTINGKIFDASRIDETAVAGSIAEWEIVNEDVFQHPFHIHVNPFKVVDLQGVPKDDPSWKYFDPDIWWDTFRMPPRGSFRMRTYYRPDAIGKTVFHCHILPHEDNGMMGTLLIKGAG